MPDDTQQEPDAMPFDANRIVDTFSSIVGSELRWRRFSEIADQLEIRLGLPHTGQRLPRSIRHGIIFNHILSSHSGALLSAIGRCPRPESARLEDEFRRTGNLTIGDISVQQAGNVGTITMQGGRNLNAESQPFLDSLEVAVDVILLSRTISVGVLRGGLMSHPKYQGTRIFCAGLDLKALRSGEIDFADFLLQRELGLLNKLIRGHSNEPSGRRNLAIPWISVIDGFAIGGGLQLLLACDHAIGNGKCYVSLPATSEGLLPGFAALRLPRFVGMALAHEMIMNAKILRSSDDNSSLLFNALSSEDQVNAALRTALTNYGSESARASKQALVKAQEPDSHFLAFAAEYALLQSLRLTSIRRSL